MRVFGTFQVDECESSSQWPRGDPLFSGARESVEVHCCRYFAIEFRAVSRSIISFAFVGSSDGVQEALIRS